MSGPGYCLLQRKEDGMPKDLRTGDCRGCKRCGWNPEEHRRRVERIRSGYLTERHGKRYLSVHISKGGVKSDG